MNKRYGVNLILDPRVKPEGDGVGYWVNLILDRRVKPGDDEERRPGVTA